jgi:hypothetical protein
MATELVRALTGMADRGEWRGADANLFAARARLSQPAHRRRRHLAAFATGMAIALLAGLGTVITVRLLLGTETPGPSISPPTSTPVTSPPTTPSTTPPVTLGPETTTSTTVPPSTSTAPTTTAAPAPSHLSCERLRERENSYGRVVAYWGKEETPADMDVDGDGIPCETAYPAADIEDLFGSPEGLEVSITENLTSWTAEGPAVVAGLICSGGEKIRTEGDGDSPWFEAEERYPDAMARISDGIFVCDDGSGEFTIGADRFFETWGGALFGGESMNGYYGAWYVIEGTGRYEQLTGGGLYRDYADGPRIGGADAVGYLSNSEASP